MLQRELEVMFSREAQPLWFRSAKWVVYIGLAAYLRRRGSRGFRVWVMALPLLGLVMHLVYRWQTKGWTQSWGRWQYDGGGRAS